ncbi:hypothetical protein [Aeromonas simiae]|uniref:Amino acid ABC transporter substrate-binding protein n=1 Tax=Aeromonas simiae TaxID=218936 RepID=A0A5J6X2Q2_9GAMM|nr:hypothetical protein [Aeromonas simiae]QFI56443.1 hypothetical protein FE240_18205 [Aeromonas simiae]
MKWLGWLCLLLPLLTQAQPLKIKVPQLPVHQLADEYQLPLLKLALEKSGTPFTIELVPTTLTQDSLRRELEEGKRFNLYWMGTSSELESRLTAIPIPLFRGMEGMRVALIHQDDQEKFAQITGLEQLRKFRAGQGIGWSDGRILDAAGIPTYAGRAANLFRLINRREAIDFFPRSLVEAFSEQHELVEPYPNLVIERHLLLRYPYAQFFFVNHDQKKLAKALQTGLERAYADGSFLRFFNQHPRVREALAGANLAGRTTITLSNPDVTDAMRKVPAHYWEWPLP